MARERVVIIYKTVSNCTGSVSGQHYLRVHYSVLTKCLVLCRAVAVVLVSEVFPSQVGKKYKFNLPQLATKNIQNSSTDKVRIRMLTCNFCRQKENFSPCKEIFQAKFLTEEEASSYQFEKEDSVCILEICILFFSFKTGHPPPKWLTSINMCECNDKKHES